MKTLRIEKNKAFLYYEFSEYGLEEILTHHSRDLRFDLSYIDTKSHQILSMWRATIALDAEGDPMLEIKNYHGKKTLIDCERDDSLSRIAALALAVVWNEIVEDTSELPKVPMVRQLIN